MPPFFEPLASHHDRAAFSCGLPSLDTYLHQYARQDVQRDLARCLVLVPMPGNAEVMGYYTVLQNLSKRSQATPGVWFLLHWGQFHLGLATQASAHPSTGV